MMTREQILDFLVDVEINPNVILKTKTGSEYVDSQLLGMFKLLNFDEDYTLEHFNSDLRILDRNVTNKF